MMVRKLHLLKKVRALLDAKSDGCIEQEKQEWRGLHSWRA